MDVFKIIKKRVWMARVEIKDAYQKYFMLQWLGKIYKFIAMPNGYSDVMRVYPKVFKSSVCIFKTTRLSVGDFYG